MMLVHIFWQTSQWGRPWECWCYEYCFKFLWDEIGIPRHARHADLPQSARSRSTRMAQTALAMNDDLMSIRQQRSNLC